MDVAWTEDCFVICNLGL